MVRARRDSFQTSGRVTYARRMILEQITEQLTETLKSRTLALFGHPVERVILQAPPKLAMGDLATPLALELAKALKRKPSASAEAHAAGPTPRTFAALAR